MEFRIADSFTGSLARLTQDEQKAVKTTAFDLQLNPAQPGLQFHRLDKPKDPRFWSIRVNKDIRLIVHRTDNSLLLCYVDHHDKAYKWAECRRLLTHPRTGAAQFVVIRETIQHIVVPRYQYGDTEAEFEPRAHVDLMDLAGKPRIFVNVSNDQLLSYGVPLEWLDDVLEATEDTLLALTDHLPGEAAEALLELATGGKPEVRAIPQVVGAVSPFDHPDAQRRFRVMTNVEELERALDYPWDQWTVFLHPAQRQWVEARYSGPARVSGSAGTGKTIVALHRAVFLTRTHPEARVLLTTFSDTLAYTLGVRLKRLISNQPRLAERLEVHSIDEIGRRLYRLLIGEPRIIPRSELLAYIKDAAAEVGNHKFSPHFLLTEWEEVVDAWQLENWEAYRDVRRLGRKTRLPEQQRTILWSIFDRVRNRLTGAKWITYAGLFNRLAAAVEGTRNPPFDFVVVDEAQDISVPHLRFLATLGGERPNSLFFAGDLGQRIFQQPFSWRAVGVDVRGRSRTLRVNYRTSHQIRIQADRLLGSEVSDADGNIEERKHTISVFNGPSPAIHILENEIEEQENVARWITERRKNGVLPHEFGIFVRSSAQLDRARAVVTASDMPFRILDETAETTSGQASVGTMHLAKGLEFRAVVVMACDDEVIPLQERIETVNDDSDLEEVYNTERHLLYVACTRARDHLLVTSVAPASEFLDDLKV